MTDGLAAGRLQVMRAARPGASDSCTSRAVPAGVHSILRSPGRPLEPGTRGFFESRAWPSALSAGAGSHRTAEPSVVGRNDPSEREADRAAERVLRDDASGPAYDFSRVRVHTEAAAAESARSLDALAYAVGDHVVFAPGRYSPESAAGRRLLAHELAHTVQHGGAETRVARQCDPALAGQPWGARVRAARGMAGGAARDQCMADMIREALPTSVTVHQSTNADRSLDVAITRGRYTEWGSLSDTHVNFDRNLNAKTGGAQYGETTFRTSRDGNTIRIFIVLGPNALDPVGPEYTQMAFEHESEHVWDFISEFALIGRGPPHGATAAEELRIYTEGFSRRFLDLWTIDNTQGRFEIADTFPQLFANFARSNQQAQDASFDSISMFFNVRIQPDACNLMKFKIWLQMMQNDRPANDALVARINALPGLGLRRGTSPATHLNTGLGCT